MKKAKKEMIRNLLYSLCLHILCLLILFFNDTINNAINKEIAHINILDVDKSLFVDNKIKTTEKDLFPELSLQEKIDLYKISKTMKDKNTILPTLINNTSNTDNTNTQTNINIVKDIINKNNSKKDEYVLYLGPTDYARYVARQEEQSRVVKVISQDGLNKNTSKNVEKDKLEDIITKVNKSDTNNINNNTKNNISNKNNQNSKELDDIISKLAVNNNELKHNIAKDVKDNIVLTNKEVKHAVIKDDNDKKILLNIDVDKIFTQKDLKQIKEIIKKDDNAFGLSARERMMVQNQLISCYKNALIQTGKKSIVKTSVTIKLFMDGIIDSKEIKIKVIDDENKFSAEDYDVAINNARVALAYCNPIRNLPSTKYQSWQNINFIFDETK